MSEEVDHSTIEDSFKVAGDEMIHFVAKTIETVTHIPLTDEAKEARKENESVKKCGPHVEMADRGAPAWGY